MIFFKTMAAHLWCNAIQKNQVCFFTDSHIFLNFMQVFFFFFFAMCTWLENPYFLDDGDYLATLAEQKCLPKENRGDIKGKSQVGTGLIPGASAPLQQRLAITSANSTSVHPHKPLSPNKVETFPLTEL